MYSLLIKDRDGKTSKSLLLNGDMEERGILKVALVVTIKVSSGCHLALHSCPQKLAFATVAGKVGRTYSDLSGCPQDLLSNARRVSGRIRRHVQDLQSATSLTIALELFEATLKIPRLKTLLA